MDSGSTYALIVAAALIASALIVLASGLRGHGLSGRRRPDPTAYGEDIDVGRCIIVGCPNWCVDTRCRDHGGEG